MMKQVLMSAALALSATGNTMELAGEPAAVPKVELVHYGLLERECGSAEAAPDPGLVNRVTDNLPEFREAWEREGRQLLAITVAVTGQPFAFAETIATLHACPGMDSMSAPLLIQAGRYLEAQEGEEADAFTRRERGHFAYTVWHEIMHRQIGALLDGRRTPLLERHAGESRRTLAHLHLLAVEQLVYRSLGREEEFHRRGRAHAGERAETGRAYQIVVAEGAEKFVAELRPAQASLGRSISPAAA